MRIWFLFGMLNVLISLLIAWITQVPEILVYFNMIIGIVSLAIAFYLHTTLRWFYIYNELRSNHNGAEYRKNNLLKYKFIGFGLPNVLFGGIINEVYGVWPWT